MAKQLLNEAEQFLIQRWGEARLLEESMDGVRTKYKEVFQRIIEAVTVGHPELDANASFPTQFWGSGLIGFGRKLWPAGESQWPSGLWVEGLRLEVLTAEDSDSPYGYLWFSHKSKANLDFDAAQALVNAAAKDVLSVEELKGTEIANSHGVLLYFTAPSKSELLRSLCDRDGQGFVDLFVSQFDLMARFVPVLEKVFRECMKEE
jgi:hypothetical protein